MIERLIFARIILWTKLSKPCSGCCLSFLYDEAKIEAASAGTEPPHVKHCMVPSKHYVICVLKGFLINAGTASEIEN